MTYADKIRDYANDIMLHPQDIRTALREAADYIDLLEEENDKFRASFRSFLEVQRTINL